MAGRPKVDKEKFHRIEVRLSERDYQILSMMSKIDKKPFSYLIRRSLNRDWMQCGYEEKAKILGLISRG